MIAFLLKSWTLFHRLKITFLLIFFSVNYGFLKRYAYDGNIWLLLIAFTLQNFALHILNNYFDANEDQITGQRTALASPSVLMFLAVLATFISAGMVLYFRFSFFCYIVLFAMMLLYSMPLSRSWRIKKVLYLKNLTGSLFWWYIPFVLITSAHTTVSFHQVLLDNTLTLAIFMPFEPLWDIKDSEGDLASGIRTIPNQFGLPATKLLVISAFLLLAVVKVNNITFVIFFLFPLMILTALISQRNKLILSQIILAYVSVHTFGGFVLISLIREYGLFGIR